MHIPDNCLALGFKQGDKIFFFRCIVERLGIKKLKYILYIFLKKELYKGTIPGLSCNKTATQYFPDLDAKNCLSPDESVAEQ